MCRASANLAPPPVELLAERLDLVAQLGGVLELELVGGLEHLGLEAGQQLLEVGARHGHLLGHGLGRAAALGGHRRRVADHLRDVADPVSYTHLTLPTIYSV